MMPMEGDNTTRKMRSLTERWGDIQGKEYRKRRKENMGCTCHCVCFDILTMIYFQISDLILMHD